MPQDSFATFAREVQYQPPPDTKPLVASTSAKPSWFASTSSGSGAETSYQAGGIPSWSDSFGGGGGAEAGPESAINEWETRFGWRVDIEAAATYIFGPISGELYCLAHLEMTYTEPELCVLALLILILETKNDFIRFHGQLLYARSYIHRTSR